VLQTCEKRVGFAGPFLLRKDESFVEIFVSAAFNYVVLFYIFWMNYPLIRTLRIFMAK